MKLKARWKAVIVITVLIILISLIAVRIRKNIRDIYREYSYSSVKSFIYENVNVTTDRIVLDKDRFGDLITVEKAENGKISHLSPNVNAVNVISNQVAVECQKDLLKESPVLSIPYGAFTGSPLLSDKGRLVEVPLTVNYTVKSDFREYLQSIGINVVRYALYLEVTTTADIAIPYNQYQADFVTYVLICENVFSTDIPDTYISSKEDLQYLDLLP